MKQVFKIFKLKFLIFKNKFRYSTLTDLIKFLILAAFVAAYMIGGQYSVHIFFEKLQEMPELTELAISKLWVSQILLLFLSAFMPLLIFGGLISFMPTFFNKKELSFNLVNNSSLLPFFSYSYFEILLKNFGFIIVAISPLLIAFGKLFETSWYYYLVMPVVIFLFAFLLVSVGISIAFFFVGVSPKTKVKAMINTATFCLTFFLIYSLFLANPVNIIGGDFVEELLRYTEQLKGSASSVKVSVITNAIFTGYVYNKVDIVISNFAKLFFGVLVMVAINFSYGYYIYKKRIISVMEESDTGILDLLTPSESMKSVFLKMVKRYPLIFKELVNLHRDQTILTQLLFIGVLSVAFIINICRTRGGDSETALFYLRLGYPATVLLLTMFAGRMVFPSISSEGRNIWLVKLSPVGIKNFVYNKFLLFFSIQFIAAVAFLTAINFINGYTGAMYVVLNFSFIISMMLTSLGFILGILLADFSEPDPWKIATGLGGVLFFIASFSVSVLPILFAVISYGNRGYRIRIVEFSAGASIITALGFYLMLNWVIKKFDARELL